MAPVFATVQLLHTCSHAGRRRCGTSSPSKKGWPHLLERCGAHLLAKKLAFKRHVRGESRVATDLPSSRLDWKCSKYSIDNGFRTLKKNVFWSTRMAPSTLQPSMPIQALPHTRSVTQQAAPMLRQHRLRLKQKRRTRWPQHRRRLPHVQLRPPRAWGP